MVLKYNSDWSGRGETLHPIELPESVYDYFSPEEHEEYVVDLPFTRETWHGRMKACRGTGASLLPDALNAWEKEHVKLLEANAPDHFTVKHYAALAVLKKRPI